MKKILLFNLLILAALLPNLVEAQEVAKRIVVEHFTNTGCSTCASRNPGFYNNLNSQEGILHISIHPSVPYNTCQLYLANTAENSARANFYNVTGTPRLIIQGVPLSSSSSYASADIFDNYINQTTPISLKTYQTKEDGQLNITLLITAETNNTIGNANLFLAAAEDVVFYNAPNGENEHYDVFRKTFTGDATGYAVTVPANAGETNILSFSLTPELDWDYDRLFAVAILQNSDDRSVIQSTASDPDDNEPLVGTTQPNTLAAAIFPNPVSELLQIRLADATQAKVQLFNTQGSLLQQQSFDRQTMLDLSDYPNGIYWLEVSTDTEKAVRKIVKE